MPKFKVDRKCFVNGRMYGPGTENGDIVEFNGKIVPAWAEGELGEGQSRAKMPPDHYHLPRKSVVQAKPEPDTMAAAQAAMAQPGDDGKSTKASGKTSSKGK